MRHALTLKTITSADGRKAGTLICACGNATFILGMAPSEMEVTEHTMYAICTRCPRKHELAYYLDKKGNQT